MHSLLNIVCLMAVAVSALPSTSSNTNSTLKGRIVTANTQYQGYVDPTTGWEFYLGVRYAAKPQRWQAPTEPSLDASVVVQANQYGSVCFQSSSNSITVAAQTATITGSEDCLFANIWRPSNVSAKAGLPVLVYIHGGGYGTGNGQNDPTFFSQANDNMNFVFVSIQYRLGALGFLSSQEVHDNGVSNAGLLDQHQALLWVQEHISAFSGDPTKVTIFGESAGGGSVMQHLISYGGTLETSLFNSAMLASPYLPSQYNYNDQIPTNLYEQFAREAGCTGSSVFACLAAADSQTVARASDTVGRTAPYGTWGFAPVVDGTFSQQRPSEALLAKKTNGQRVLAGNNAAEGVIFVPQNITTSIDVTNYVQNFFPTLSSTDIYTMLKTYYPEPALSGGLYSTQLLRASQIYGDVTFDCTGNIVADAYTQAWRYRYAVADSYHGLDVPAYLPSATESLPFTDDSFLIAFDNFLESFFTGGTPFINYIQSVPQWQNGHQQAKIDAAGVVTLYLPVVYAPILVPIPLSGSPIASLESGLRLTNGVADRCAFWASLASKVSI